MCRQLPLACGLRRKWGKGAAGSGGARKWRLGQLGNFGGAGNPHRLNPVGFQSRLFGR